MLRVLAYTATPLLRRYRHDTSPLRHIDVSRRHYADSYCHYFMPLILPPKAPPRVDYL